MTVREKEIRPGKQPGKTAGYCHTKPALPQTFSPPEKTARRFTGSPALPAAKEDGPNPALRLLVREKTGTRQAPAGTRPRPNRRPAGIER